MKTLPLAKFWGLCTGMTWMPGIQQSLVKLRLTESDSEFVVRQPNF